MCFFDYLFKFFGFEGNIIVFLELVRKFGNWKLKFFFGDDGFFFNIFWLFI